MARDKSRPHMKPRSLREITLLLENARAHGKKGELFRVGSERERNDVLTAARALGFDAMTQKVKDNVFRVVIP